MKAINTSMTNVALQPAAKLRITALRSAPLRVDREARVINGYAVITRGEALGHGMWIDKEMLSAVVAAGNAKANGIKSRFTHPGLCADGMGKYLGRSKNFRLDGDTVRADLHIAPVSDASPDGRLGSYVLDLAEEDPESFGASIVFARDADAEDKFIESAGGKVVYDEWCGRIIQDFKSPDPLNTENLPHARLSVMTASDVVDEPAANPNGFFSSGDEFASRAESALRFIFGIDQNATPELFGAIAPERAKTFVNGFLARHGLSVGKESAMPAKLEDGKCEPEDKKPEVTEGEKKPDEKKEDEAMSTLKVATLAELEAKFSDPAFVLAQLKAGATMEQAELAWKDKQIADLQAENAKLKANQKAPGAEPVTFANTAAGEGTSKKDFLEVSKEYAAEHKVPLSKAMSACASLHPELFKAYKAKKN